ncbi:hypothetical protein LguiA_000013 [Lonicera macranthoides]
MAASSVVHESFKARVDKIFGSLTSSSKSSSLSSSSSSPWSLTDGEVEKREWSRRDKVEPNRDDETPCSSSFDVLFFKNKKNLRRRRRNKSPSTTLLDDLEDPKDDDDDGSANDEWEIRSSIGLDCTLDYEEEEDEYDKLAEGRENAGDRLYMKNVTDHGPYLNSHNVLPTSIHVVCRDPRANRYAGKIRLKKDEVAATGKLDSDQTGDKFKSDTREDPHIMASEDSVQPKSILKRKENATTAKSSKRVKFDPDCKEDDCEEASEKYNGSLTASVNDSSVAKNAPRVPDYLLNPSKYVCYSFDSTTDIDEKSIMLEQKLDDASSIDTPISVVFIPRKKTSEAKAAICNSEVKQNHGDGSKQSSTQASSALGIAAGDVQQNEIGLMEENKPEIGSAGIVPCFKRPSRHYRNKSSEEDTVA